MSFHEKKYHFNRKGIYLLLLIVITLSGFVLKNTYAKFASENETANDIVSLNLSFDVKLSKLEEYEEVSVAANSYEVFNVNINNQSTAIAYYGIWYQMVSPDTISSNITIAKSSDSAVSTSGSISASSNKTAVIMVKNATSSPITINIGVATSSSSTSAIEYLDGKKLISGTLYEANYYYDDTNSKYVYSSNTSITFTTAAKTFSYTGSYQTFTPDHAGAYQLEAWGAQGGSTNGGVGGKGAYTSGIIDLSRSTSLYVYVGEYYNGYKAANCFNGGGHGGYSTSEKGNYNANGGGATDFRLTSGTWNTTSSLASRIMVAAGGGGGSTYLSKTMTGGVGGALTGGVGTYQRANSSNTNTYTPASGATQTAGGQIPTSSGATGTNGSFGYGGYYGSASSASYFYYAGGGGGYYGGASGGVLASAVVGGASGGSSYISGYTGCVAITSASSTTPKSGCSNGTSTTSCSYHYSGRKFINATMKAGNQSMPTQSGSSTMTGNSGNGFAKATPVVPTVTVPSSITKGTQLASSQITCSGQAGCSVVKIYDTTKFETGTQSVTIVVKDNFGYTYKYKKSIRIK